MFESFLVFLLYIFSFSVSVLLFLCVCSSLSLCLFFTLSVSIVHFLCFLIIQNYVSVCTYLSMLLSLLIFLVSFCFSSSFFLSLWIYYLKCKVEIIGCLKYKWFIIKYALALAQDWSNARIDAHGLKIRGEGPWGFWNMKIETNRTLNWDHNKKNDCGKL